MSFRPGVAQMARRFSALVNHKTRRAVAASVERRFFLNYSNLYRRLEARGLHRDMGRSRGAQAPTRGVQTPTHTCRWPATGDGSGTARNALACDSGPFHSPSRESVRIRTTNGPKVAERMGFEPMIRISPYNGLANRRLQPLGHLSGSRRYAQRDRCWQAFPCETAGQ